MIVEDVRGVPGDIVLTRGPSPINVWDVHRSGGGRGVIGVVNPGAMGIIICVYSKEATPDANPGFTYVLWSNPILLGWVPDGRLRLV